MYSFPPSPDLIHKMCFKQHSNQSNKHESTASTETVNCAVSSSCRVNLYRQHKIIAPLHSSWGINVKLMSGRGGDQKLYNLLSLKQVTWI